MQTINDQVSFKGQLADISISELRAAPGDVLKQVELGKVFIISKLGKPVAVLSAVPGEQLTIIVQTNGEKKYGLASG